MTQSADTQFPDSQPRQNIAVSMLRRGDDRLRDAVKGILRACADPMTCSTYWIGSSPPCGVSRNEHGLPLPHDLEDLGNVS